MDVEGMNAKGIMFSFMVLLMFLGMVVLIDYIKEERQDTSKYAKASVLSNLQGKINNLQNNIIELPIGNKAKRIFERILPFSYSYADSNYLDLNFSLPFESGKISNFFDTINSYAVFIYDTEHSNVYDGLPVSVSTIKNPVWGGSSTSVHFLVLPQCMQFYNTDLNLISFNASSSTSCAQQFSMNLIDRIDLNIALYGDDFNAMLCNSAPCPQDAYSISSPNPYLNISLNTANCPSCFLTQKKISKHFNPSQDLNIFIYCQGISCSSQPLKIMANNSLSINSLKTTTSSMRIIFGQNIESLLFDDFNIIVASDSNIASSKAKAANKALPN